MARVAVWPSSQTAPFSSPAAPGSSARTSSSNCSRARTRDRRARQLRPRYAARTSNGRGRSSAARRRGLDHGSSSSLADADARRATTSSTSPRSGCTNACTSRARRSRSTSSARTTSSRPRATPGVERSSTRRRLRSTATRVAIPMTEEHPFNNRTMYGATKIAGEQFFRAFHEQHGLDYVGPALHERLRPADGLQGDVRQRDHEGARPDRRRGARR